MTAPTDLVERVARAICEADQLAPAPDVNIYIGAKAVKAWEARIPMARAALAAADRLERNMELHKRIEALETALRTIHAKQYEHRETVSPETAWSAYGRLNKAICEVFDIAGRALDQARNDR